MSIYSDSIKISDLFLTKIKKFTKENGVFVLENSYKKMILLDSRNLVMNNNLEVLIKEIESISLVEEEKELINSYNISNLLKKYSKNKFNYEKGIIPDGEILEFGKFYVHPVLQKSSKPPKFILDENMNLIEQPLDPFYLEIIDSFTMNDLIKYFFVKTKNVPIESNSINNNFKRILDTFNLDIALYMIDYAVQYAIEENLDMPRSPIYLMDNANISGALSIYEDRKNSLHEKRIDYEISRT